MYLCRENDVGSISRQHLGIVGHGIHVYSLELYLAACEVRELSKARVGTESLTELVALKANGQHERVPLVFCERLVKVQHRVFIGGRAIFEIIKIVAVLVKNKVGTSLIAGVEQTEVVKHRPLVICYVHSLVVLVVANNQSETYCSIIAI